MIGQSKELYFGSLSAETTFAYPLAKAEGQPTCIYRKDESDVTRSTLLL